MATFIRSPNKVGQRLVRLTCAFTRGPLMIAPAAVGCNAGLGGPSELRVVDPRQNRFDGIPGRTRDPIVRCSRDNMIDVLRPHLIDRWTRRVQADERNRPS